MGVLDGIAGLIRSRPLAGRVGPHFEFRNSGSIGVGTAFTKGFEDSAGAESRWMPFSKCTIQNNGAYAIEFRPNGIEERKIVVLNRAARDFDDVPLFGFEIWGFETGTDIGANKVTVTCWNE